ncbi:5'-methylthioadenosine/adenosylhomocysteine nucleosidase [Hallella bergensis]|uniref:5'-methylthioadenosine/adenosylhomocysteine nucleosidase n=1 Tax=Hallella bergensis TaxID=242750 RepID=UPI0023F38A1E|nr:5'-methylthioadenosine/adenosylhomocysteine nucleosidase [Hallella bergensis]
MKRIGILVAMDKEFVQLKTLLQEVQTERRNLKDFVTGHMDDVEIIMQQCGVGKVNSAIGAVEMIDCYHPDLMISTGVAGGADAELNPLDVVVASECTYHDVYCGAEMEYGQVMDMPSRFVAPVDLVDKALRLNGLDMGAQVKSGLIVSGDWFVDSREKMQEILSHFPQAMAVDMESCSIAQTCHIYNVPFISFRIISDVPLKDNRAAQYFDFWDRMAEGSFEITKAFLKQII